MTLIPPDEINMSLSPVPLEEDITLTPIVPSAESFTSPTLAKRNSVPSSVEGAYETNTPAVTPTPNLTPVVSSTSNTASGPTNAFTSVGTNALNTINMKLQKFSNPFSLKKKYVSVAHGWWSLGRRVLKRRGIVLDDRAIPSHYISPRPTSPHASNNESLLDGNATTPLVPGAEAEREKLSFPDLSSLMTTNVGTPVAGDESYLSTMTNGESMYSTNESDIETTANSNYKVLSYYRDENIQKNFHLQIGMLFCLPVMAVEENPASVYSSFSSTALVSFIKDYDINIYPIYKSPEQYLFEVCPSDCCWYLARWKA